MQYRTLSLQESFGTTRIQSFQEAKGNRGHTSLYDTGGKLPNVIPNQQSYKPAILQPHPSTSMIYDKNMQRENGDLIVVVSVLVIISVAVIIYWNHKRVLRDEEEETSLGKSSINDVAHTALPNSR